MAGPSHYDAGNGDVVAEFGYSRPEEGPLPEVIVRVLEKTTDEIDALPEDPT